MPAIITFTSKEAIVGRAETDDSFYREEGRYTLPGPHGNVHDVIRANKNAGEHFFDAATMRFFSSRVAHGVTLGRIFVTSEQNGELPRYYTARIVDDDGHVEVLSDFQQFGSLGEAVRFVMKVEQDWFATKAEWTLRFPTDAQLETALVLHAEGITDLDDLQAAVTA
jgi:hypothetical protein